MKCGEFEGNLIGLVKAGAINDLCESVEIFFCAPGVNEMTKRPHIYNGLYGTRLFVCFFKEVVIGRMAYSYL